MYIRMHEKGACIHRQYTSFITVQDPYQPIIPLRRYDRLKLRIYCPTADENRFLVGGLGVEEKESSPLRNVTQDSTHHTFPRG